MTGQNTRLAAIRDLLGDAEARKSRDQWDAILSDESLTPATQTTTFQKQLLRHFDNRNGRRLST